ncbi:MAG: glutamate 5-kinase [Chloroflexi bacterium]|nr:MAG: glutamate 5-kinase [Chloroflexota bacterium]
MAKGSRRTATGRDAGSAPLRYQRIVAKFGTNVLTAGTDRLDIEVIRHLVGQVATLHAQSADVIVVTSGAIAAGRYLLRDRRERKDMPYKQVLAAVGQSDLMQTYREIFSHHGITIAQTLLTRRDLADRQGYLNARNTLLAMLELRVVPVINENDVVAVDEIEGAKIGDNDNLSALVANLVDADLLVLLTDTGGLHTADPRRDPSAQLIERVDRIDSRIEALAGGAFEGPGVGGMATKLQAARLAVGGGADTIIAAGGEPDVLVGAAKVLREARRSLLPAGVQDVRGPFQRGEAVAVLDSDGRRIACGIANYASEEIMRIRGLRSDRIEETLGHHYGSEVVHRDNLVLL